MGGHANTPIQHRRPRHISTATAVGTGSNMAGESNSTTVRGVWNWFERRGARCIEVPYWLHSSSASEQMAYSAGSPTRSDVYFHRTSSVGAADSFEENSLDVVYIDGDHKWWSVLQDIVAWWPKVRPGGFMMGHDFHFNTLMERENAPGGDSNDVPVALAIFFREPNVVSLHPGFVWSVTKPLSGPDDDTGMRLALCR